MVTVEQMTEWLLKAFEGYASTRIGRVTAEYAAERVVRQMAGKPVDECPNCRGFGFADGRICSQCKGEKYVFLGTKKTMKR